VLAELSHSKAPVLAITGSEDTTVPPENAGKIAAASTNPSSRVFTVDGADHTYNIFTGDLTAFDILTAETLKWFLSTL
jgi:pimeloyl-ACP methyl ester carboxylesterase